MNLQLALAGLGSIVILAPALHVLVGPNRLVMVIIAIELVVLFLLLPALIH